jgi:hypothetical protein
MAKIGPDEERLNRKFKKWDRGILTYTSAEDAIRHINPGKHFGKHTSDLLKRCSVCPVGNASCQSFFKIIIYGFNPKKGHVPRTVRICPHGCNEQTCLLNK